MYFRYGPLNGPGSFDPLTQLLLQLLDKALQRS
jgi:hypothetical protein